MALEEINVRTRQEKGKGPVGRMRKEGLVPAVIYGHGKEGESLTVERRVIERVIHAHHHMVSLKNEADGSNRRAFIKDVQYNALNDHVTHVDFQEVGAHEKIELSIPLVFKGEPVGVKDGGVLQTVMHELAIACDSDAVIDDLVVKIGNLKIDDAIHIRDLGLPAGVEATDDPDELVIAVRKAREEEEDEADVAEGAGEAAPAEPEVLTERKKDEDEA